MTLLHSEDSSHNWVHTSRLGTFPGEFAKYSSFLRSHARSGSSLVVALAVIEVVGAGVGAGVVVGAGVGPGVVVGAGVGAAVVVGAGVEAVVLALESAVVLALDSAVVLALGSAGVVVGAPGGGAVVVAGVVVVPNLRKTAAFSVGSVLAQEVL